MDGRNVRADNVLTYNHGNLLKSRENIFKPKCNKALKRKLKKYKLRKDGCEDPDIIDVSETLINSLKIKSPTNTQKVNKSKENKPLNYLTKMVRLKKLEKDVAKCVNNIEDVSTCLTPKTDQDKKQTDAFKLLMDSRNKSIGSNSPGKEKGEEECNMQEKIEKKEIKAKRNLSLKRMAEAKGSATKVELEEYRKERIKRKMDERAKRFRSLIESTETKNGKTSKMSSIINIEEDSINANEQEENETRELVTDRTSILKTFNIFKDLGEPQTNTIEKISKEDEEFLKKLSPSLKKKENMLCYFQKVNKDSEALENELENISQNEGQVIIKVKLTSKTKGKKKNIKYLSDKKTNLDNVLNCELISNSSRNNSHKRKRNCNILEKDKNKIRNNNDKQSSQYDVDSRPKRNIKKPIKYIDDFQLSSSDEELHIFTPKKKRKQKHDSESALMIVDDNNSLQINQNAKTDETDVKVKQTNFKKQSKKVINLHKISDPPKVKSERKMSLEKMLTPKKATKLAPIFITKTQFDSAALEAKQRFLHSGVPKQLKRNCNVQTNVIATDDFQPVVHVQNLHCVNIMENSDIPILFDKNYDENLHIRNDENLFKKLVDHTGLDYGTMPKLQKNIDQILKDIKVSYPKFPVYRTYHLLREKSKGDFKEYIYPDLDNSIEVFSNTVDVSSIDPNQLNWSDKYKPTTEKQVIGNFESVKELKRWLVSWTESNAKRNTDNASDSSDFYQSDASSRDSMKNVNNLLIITGKVGSGKTMSVYAVAAELSIKVIEVNASTKRTGKIMLQDLQEATQSHKVNRGKSSTESSQKSQHASTCNDALKVIKKRGRKKKVKESVTTILTNKEESNEATMNPENRTAMSLILIDDADIVFDQDDGFCSAISQLIQSSKRPVILVTSSLSYPHLQRFLNAAKIIKMRPFLPRMLGTWLDIMCLVDINMCSLGLGAKTLDFFKGDIRKSINHLQFYMTSHKYLCTETSVETSPDDHRIQENYDENSCLSLIENEALGDKNHSSIKPDDISLKYFVNKQFQLIQPLNSFRNFSVWWNLPDLLCYSMQYCDEKRTEKSKECDKSKENVKLNVIAEVVDTMSLVDFLENSNVNNELNTTSKPWYSCESASVIDTENFTTYDKSNDCINDITCELVTKSISEAQRLLECSNMTEINYPGMTMDRERDRVVSRYNTLTSHLNPSAVLDRRAMALDYWPTCRNICRTEKTKTDKNSKRNNRFCHYLKSLNILCKNDFFDNLGDSLNPSDEC